mgnify:CR=1 FL=1
MEIKDFVQNFADQFDDTEADLFTAGTKFRELEEWSSLITLSIIAMLMEALGISAKDVMVDTEALESVIKKLRVIKKKASDMDSVYQMLAEDIADVHA